ncbi:MAG: FAD-dependent oxidoreductase [Candidatus Marinimicrobia bacterium]|nr:FAD-dependent oxidoreductase [Candidatus Neomarinimicrobiota bacterium]
MGKKLVIIGGDAAGMSAASKIRRIQPEAELIVFEKGRHISYAACGIPYWISGVVEDGGKLEVLTAETARNKRNIDVRLGHEVTRIDIAHRVVSVHNHETGDQFDQPFDGLLIATGASATIPPIPGIDKTGVFSLRSLTDGQLIIDYIKDNEVAHATIIGGGYIGLEMAESFRQRNIAVTIVERADQLAATFDKDILESVTEHVLEQGVDLRLNTTVISIESVEKGLQINTTGESIKSDIVLVSSGVGPNSKLASDAGIALGAGRAIRIDEHMETSIPGVYAAGDCAAHKHLVLNEDVWIPLAPTANRGGRIAGENMAGIASRFKGMLGTASVKVFDFTIAQTGLTGYQANQSGLFGEIETSMITAGSRAHYYPGSTPVTIKLVVEKSSKRLLGAQMVGRADIAKRLDVLATAITAKMTVEDIGMLDLSYAPPIAPVYDPIHVAANVANK